MGMDKSKVWKRYGPYNPHPSISKREQGPTSLWAPRLGNSSYIANEVIRIPAIAINEPQEILDLTCQCYIREANLRLSRDNVSTIFIRSLLPAVSVGKRPGLVLGLAPVPPSLSPHRTPAKPQEVGFGYIIYRDSIHLSECSMTNADEV